MKKYLKPFFPGVFIFLLFFSTTSCQFFNKKADLSESWAIIQEQVESESKSYPFEMGPLTANFCEFNGQAVTYDYTLDEWELEMSDLKNRLSLMAEDVKARLLEQTKIPSFKRFFDACAKANVSLVYQYTGDESNEMCQIVFYPKNNKTEIKTGLVGKKRTY